MQFFYGGDAFAMNTKKERRSDADCLNQSQQLAAQVFLNASFTLYFILDFGGKIALIQLWEMARDWCSFSIATGMGAMPSQ